MCIRDSCYNELANTPFFLWDPRSCVKDVHRQALCQTIDIPATLLDYFGVERPAEMRGCSMKEVVASDQPVRHWALFGFHGSFVNITDGRYLYMRAAANVGNSPCLLYTSICGTKSRTLRIRGTHTPSFSLGAPQSPRG